jgi:hypothetical protein
VDLLDHSVQNSDLMPTIDQRVNDVRADEAGAAGYQYVHS